VAPVTPVQLIAAAQELAEYLPDDAEISRNSVGNLAATRSADCFVWVDVDTGEVHWMLRGVEVPPARLPAL
jgi:hypothetical protein